MTQFVLPSHNLSKNSPKRKNFKIDNNKTVIRNGNSLKILVRVPGATFEAHVNSMLAFCYNMPKNLSSKRNPSIHFQHKPSYFN